MFSVGDLQEKGRTLLGRAAANGDFATVERMLRAGAPADEPDLHGETPLHMASMFGHLSIVRVLVEEYGVEVEAPNFEGWTPLCWAVVQGHLEVAEYLYAHGAEINVLSSTGYHPLHLAASAGQRGAVEWLLGEGVDPAALTRFGATPLDIATDDSVRRILVDAAIAQQHS